MAKFRKRCNKVLRNLADAIEPLMEEYNEVTSGPQSDYTRKRARQLADKISDLKSEAVEAADHEYESYLERLEAKAQSLSGATIDQGDAQLLNSPILTLTQKEFDIMQDRYKGNRAMERLLSAYADKHEDLDCQFMSDNAKLDIAKNTHRELSKWISNNGEIGMNDYAMAMAGDMFGSAESLDE